MRALKAWYRMDSNAPWRGDPGRSPFKREGNVFSSVPGGGNVSSIRPDIVHTFHIGFGCDMAASMIVWMARMGVFPTGSNKMDDKLLEAFSRFQAFCHDTNRYNACESWSTKKFGMNSSQGFAQIVFYVGQWLVIALKLLYGSTTLYRALHIAKDTGIPGVYCREGARHSGRVQVAAGFTFRAGVMVSLICYIRS